MHVLHKCDVRQCVNPDHLFLGSNADNVDDMVAKHRHMNQRKTHCQNGHPLLPENLRAKKNGSRNCLICHRERQRELRKADPEKHREAVRRHRAKRKALLGAYAAEELETA
jgi:hypothetical protein